MVARGVNAWSIAEKLYESQPRKRLELLALGEAREITARVRPPAGLAAVALASEPVRDGVGRVWHGITDLFRGDEPENAAKGRWQVLDSPMTLFLPHEGTTERVNMGRLDPRKPLAAPPKAISSAEMMATVRYLASPELEGRGVGTGGLGLAADFVARGIRCNAICPGTVESPSLRDRIASLAQSSGQSLAQAEAAFVARQPMGRLGRAEEIAALAVYLASDESAFTTGATHVIDGGWSI